MSALPSPATSPALPAEVSPTANARTAPLAPAAAPPSVPRAPRGGRLLRWLDILGLTWFTPLVSIAYGEPAGYHLRRLLRMVGLPALMVVIVLVAWSAIAASVKVGSFAIPGPGIVAERGVEMWRDWRKEAARREAHAGAAAIAADAYLADQAKERGRALTASEAETLRAEVIAGMPFEAKRTFLDQILLSLRTVFIGVLIAVVIAVPIGIICGLSAAAFEMLNPVIQVLKPVSPVAWFPVVYIFVNKAMENPPPGSAFPKSFVMAGLVVGLCAIWPTLINTANGVANVERDYLNVAKVLNLGWFRKVFTIILPASLPQVFTGIRLSLGTGWMVLIAAELMAVSPGLGGFIWDWYQSSNETSLSYLVLAVIVIGIIGFFLDRLMITTQKLVSPGATLAVR